MAKTKKGSNKILPNSTKNKKRKDIKEKDDTEETNADLEKLPPKKQILKKMKIESPSIKMKKAINLLSTEKKNTKSSKVDEDEEIQEPTTEELLESEKPENIKAVLTVREKKRLKHQQRLEEQKSKLPNKEVERNEEYLIKWKNNRKEWKFEKLRQVNILQSVFDETKIRSEIWPIVLEYLSGSKGAAKDTITKAAEAVIDKLDKEAEKANDEKSTLITASEKYRRARQLLQS